MELTNRPRRLRRTPALRRFAREVRLHPSNLVAPLFVEPGSGVRKPIQALPGHYRWSPDTAAEEAARLQGLGVGAVILFGIPPEKDATGSRGWDVGGPVPEALRAIAGAAPDIVRMADVCLCEYTDHGHCGILDATGGDVVNDATLPLLGKEAVAYAAAGADIVAPSAMMDGQVAAIRHALDERAFTHTAILAYAAKTASAFYGPFRDAAGSTPGKGDRRGYQMDAANRDEALREVLLDLEEGADAVMVKPAGSNLDLVRDVANAVDCPVSAYQVSGEYAMLHAAATAGVLDLDAAAYESLLGIRRAGARWILTYFADHAAEALRDGRWDAS
ncbi:MAG: porphobilinogen synthase [Planctomycetota bacterium]|jgi:porphobilinogen synthase